MTKLELGFYDRIPFLTPTKLKLGLWLEASVAFAFNSLAQGPVTPQNVTSVGNPRRTQSQPDTETTRPLAPCQWPSYN